MPAGTHIGKVLVRMASAVPIFAMPQAAFRYRPAFHAALHLVEQLPAAGLAGRVLVVLELCFGLQPNHK